MPRAPQADASTPRRSSLVPAGMALVGLGLFAPALLQPAALQAKGHGEVLWRALFILTDLFRAGFFVGIACWIIGGLRNRRWRREAVARAATPPQA